VTRLLLVLALLAGLANPAAAEDSPFRSFEDVAAKVVDAFTTEMAGVRNIRVDLRRRDTLPDADVTIVGVLGMDIKPRTEPAWYSIRLLFGQHDGRWRFLTAYHELPGAGPVWAEAAGTYRAIAEQAIGPSGQ